MTHDDDDARAPLYGAKSRELQDRFDSRRLADRVEERLCRDHVTDADRTLIESLDMFFLATVSAEGQPTCSYKGGDPGFVRVPDATSLVFPSYDGNGMFLSLGNVMETAQVGLLFVDFLRGRRLRVHGRATIDDDVRLRESWPGAQLVIRVAVTHVFPNCSRYVHRYERTEHSPFVPRTGVDPPVPSWKTSEWASDVLPEGDPARKKL